MAPNTICDTDALRTVFSKSMSRMYQEEVPLYSDLLNIVTEVNAKTMTAMGPDIDRLDDVDINRITLERHGAIRLGTPLEMATVRRLFALLGMFPVGYYDLSIAGLPMHATAFRAVNAEALCRNPFRVFTTVLRPELLSDDCRLLSESVLATRNIFSKGLSELLDAAESRGGVLESERDDFIRESLATFSWRRTAVVSYDDYLKLKSEHPVLADVVSFPAAHINHLTPRTLDIDLAQASMHDRGLQAKERIEGPPRRNCQILLRQTSFKALGEPVDFPSSSCEMGVVRGVHSARFGEIEQRGFALSKKGRELYDHMMVETSREFAKAECRDVTYEEILQDVFKQFPDDLQTLEAQGLIFCRYKPTGKGLLEQPSCKWSDTLLIDLVKQGFVEYEPITYEDFLPFSAAGIFQSNLGTLQDNSQIITGYPAKEQLEKFLGRETLDPMKLYSALQQESIEHCITMLNYVNPEVQ